MADYWPVIKDFSYDKKILSARQTEFPIHPLLQTRISPYEMTGEEMSDDELFPLFEAMRWAPSHYNLQPWKVIYAKRNTVRWFKFLDLLVPLNKRWAQNASVLVAFVSAKTHEHNGEIKENTFHSFDTGSAWFALALEGSVRGLAVHAMGGVEYERAYGVLKLSKEEHYLNAIVAIGKRFPANKRASEVITQRRPIRELIFEGEFDNSEGIIVKN